MTTPALAALRAVTSTCVAAAWSFSDEQAAEGLIVVDKLRAVFLPPPPAASSATQQPQQHVLQLLQLLPTELLTEVLSRLDTHGLARLASTCRPLWRDAPTPPLPLLRPMGAVEAELRRRFTARGLRVVSSLPDGALSWVPYLLKRALREALRREAPLAVGFGFSLFVDAEGRLWTCGTENNEGFNGAAHLLGHAVDPDDDLTAPRSVDPPTLVPSMQGKCIVSVATGGEHCLALSCAGEVYSWGEGHYGSLGHADGSARAVPSRIESLSMIESIKAGPDLKSAAVGPDLKSAAVDEVGRLFTWGLARDLRDKAVPSGLGYAIDSQTECQLTPMRVDALSEDRVVGIALGSGFTLAVTDTSTVFSCGSSWFGLLGHGAVGPVREVEVLPRRIEALAQTEWRFVAVAAGANQALALTEEGELYGWGREGASGHEQNEPTPRQVTAFVGQRVKHVSAGDSSSCAVTETGELYTWGNGECGQLGHEDWDEDEPDETPKRVEGLNGVKVAAAAMCSTHTLVADEDGVVWAFGEPPDEGGVVWADMPEESQAWHPTPISTLRVRVRKSPDVLPFLV